MAAPSEEKVICDKFNLEALTVNQVKSFKALADGKDVFIGTKTGSGKSLSYESIPVIFPGSLVIVIAPLVSIMKEQCSKLNKLGFNATYIGKDASESDRIIRGHFEFLFGSPEQLVGEVKWREMLTSDVYQENLRALVVDEAHTVIQWGESTQHEEPFRAWFSKIGELRSLCPKAQMIALTATSGPAQRRKIMKHLCFTGNNEVIVESPDRTNIKLTSKCIPNNDILDNVFGWLIEDLKKKKQLMPRHVLFCETIADVSKLYAFFVRQFGINCDLIDMFHSKTNDKIKEKIKNDMAVDGKIRLLICTNSAGMGVNFYGLHNIIHYGLPREMDTFVQQMGRCGRDGQFSHELILYKAHKGHLKKVETDLVKLAKDNTECRRLTLCNSYLINKSEIAPIHNCCDVCEKNCECSDENCPNAHIATKFEKDETPEDQMNRTVTEVEKRLLKQRLVGLKLQLSGDSQTHVLQPELIHGLTDEVISDIGVKSEILFTPDDVMKNCHIWSYETGVAICNIITQIFGDEEMYNTDEDTSTDSE